VAIFIRWNGKMPDVYKTGSCAGMLLNLPAPSGAQQRKSGGDRCNSRGIPPQPSKGGNEMKPVSGIRSSLVVVSLLLAACGGGGGGGGSAPASMSYGGATTQATVTASNAKALSVDAYQGGQAGSTVGMMGVVQDNGGAPAYVSRPQVLASTLESSVKQVLAAGTGGTATAAGVTQQVTIPGPAGGSMSYTISVDPTTYAFSGTVTYSAYKADPNGAAISGTMTFSGVINMATQTFSSLTVSFSSITVTDGGNTFSAGGSVTLTLSGSTETTVVSLVLQNSVTGKTYWVKDYTYTLSAQGTLTVTGTYYDYVYGYVTVSTLTPLTVSSSGSWPTGGVLLFTGANGGKARLTFTATGYTVEVDTGNGIYTPVP